MAGKTGLDSKIGFALESNYGEIAATGWGFFPGTENIKAPQEYDEGEDLQAGLYGMSLDLMTQTTRRAEGSLTIKPASKGFNKVLNLFHGNTISSSGSGTAKTWVHNIGRSLPDGKTVSVQVAAPGTDGVDVIKTALGMAGTSLEFTMEAGKSLTATLGLAGQDVVFDEDEVGGGYPVGFETFSSKRSSFTIDGVKPDGQVSKVTLKIDTPKNTGRYGLDGTGLAAEPVSNAKQKVSGTYTIELQGEAQIAAYKAAGPREIQLQCLGKNDIETGVKPELTLLVPNAVAKDGIPVAEGPDVLVLEVPFDGYLAGTDPSFRATVVTTDTTAV